MALTDTIYALSSGGLPSGVAVIRLSGPGAMHAAEELSGPLPVPRMAALRTIRSRNKEIIDRGLVIVFGKGSSFTGEEVVEFHLHGGRAVVARMLSELGRFPAVRQAEAGEFSRRAFENGKADLVEMEGLSDLIAAETEMQRRLAIEQSAGGLSRIYNDWADRLTRARAFIEAELDFADEDDVPDSVANIVWSDIRLLVHEIGGYLEQVRQGEIVRNGLKVVIVGPPNAGKSSLMNALAGREIAIVTDIAGTTRDILHVDLDIGGFLVRLYDTAGLHDTSERVEQEGIRRALAAAETADVVLELTEIGSSANAVLPVDGEIRRIRVGTKRDLHGAGEHQCNFALCISTSTGDGLDELRELLIADLRDLALSRTAPVPVRDRQITLLQAVRHHLQGAIEQEGAGLDIRSEFLRLASHELGKITGRVDVENLLDVIFSEFCIGK